MSFDPNAVLQRLPLGTCNCCGKKVLDHRLDQRVGVVDEFTPLNDKREKRKVEDCALNESTNVLLLFRLDDFHRRSKLNFWLALMSLLCCAVNIGLFCLNYTLNNDPNPPHVSERTFHLTEFWTTFLYALVDAYALVTSPKTLVTICYNTTFLKLLFFFNVVAALVPAFLITMDTEYFETVAHEIEYVNEFSLSLVSFILLGSLLGTPTKAYNDVDDDDIDDDDGLIKPPMCGSPFPSFSSLGLVSLSSVVVAAITLFVYNMGHEEYAHYLEFTFNICTCLITFWFCMDNRSVAELELGQILFGLHRDCNLCRASESEFRRSVINATTLAPNAMNGTSSSSGGSSNNRRNQNLFYSWTQQQQPPPKLRGGQHRPQQRDEMGSLTNADEKSGLILPDFVPYDADMNL
jgi:hypothetical protein